MDITINTKLNWVIKSPSSTELRLGKIGVADIYEIPRDVPFPFELIFYLPQMKGGSFHKTKGEATEAAEKQVSDWLNKIGE